VWIAKVQPDEAEVPNLRAALATCRQQPSNHGPGAPSNLEPSSSSSSSGPFNDDGVACGRVAFDLATALLSMGWDELSQQQGAALYQSLAAR
jgi:hypothetical protein